MADEIEEAAQRLLAFLPDETRALLDDAEHILGMTQLVAENAKRCGAEVVGPGWYWGLGDDCWDETWAVCGVGLRIDPPRWHDRKLWAAKFWSGQRQEVEAFTFPELFDKIVATAMEIREAAEETADADICPANEWTPSFLPCGPPLFTGVPKCGGL